MRAWWLVLALAACVPNKRDEPPADAGQATSLAVASSDVDAGPSFDERLFVELHDAFIAQLKVDGPKLAQAIDRNDYPAVGDARLAVMDTMTPGRLKVRDDFIGPLAKRAKLDAPLVTMMANQYGRAHPDVAARESQRVAAAIEPELQLVFAALRRRFPDDAGAKDAARDR